MNKSAPLILAILDGWGIGKNSDDNAVHVANTPNMDRWAEQYPCTSLVAHNGLVGLPEGQMGNSEVGHLNIGAGRIVYQDFTRINLAVESGDFQKNEAFLQVFERVKESGKALHLAGLISDGGVHSHLDHLVALVEMAAAREVEQVYIHCFMDGRDTPPKSGLSYIKTLIAELERIGTGQISTICGRYWAMDRDKRWDRVAKAWEAVVHGRGQVADNPVTVLEKAYGAGETDEFVTPTVVAGKAMEDGDGLIMFNFRADRVRELCHAFSDVDFDGFATGKRPQLCQLVTMTEYEASFAFPIAFPPLELHHILGEEVSRQGKHQLRIAETEKYAHVTYFFNGGEEEPYEGEDRLLIESPREVATYDLKPEMSALEVTDRLLEALAQQEANGTPYDLVILNFANGDMVGHTGVMAAAIKACETVDACMGRIAAFVQEREGTILITADHGNAEMMVNPETGGPYTAHTLSPVPFILLSEKLQNKQLRPGGALKDIAPTILELLGLTIPVAMEGENLIV